jgi:hypothetical protein
MSVSIQPIINTGDFDFPYEFNDDQKSKLLFNIIVNTLAEHTKCAIERKVSNGKFIAKFSEDPYEYCHLLENIKVALEHTVIPIKDGSVVINPRKECYDYIYFEVIVIE